MSWGYKIVILFGGFVVLIIVMVGISMSQKDIHLVTEKYYEKEIAYQDQIDIENNTAGLENKPVVAYEVNNQVVKITYPENIDKKELKGTILFYRPSNANKDFKVKVEADEDDMQEVLVGHLEKGLWKIKMEWASGDDNYFIEEKVVLK